jgi:hypothetical protein
MGISILYSLGLLVAVLIMDLVIALNVIGTDEREVLWEDLAGTDMRRVRQAIQRLADQGEQAVALLRERLPPVTTFGEAPVSRLFAEMIDDKDPQRQEAAREELERLGESAEPALAREMDQV